MKIKDYRYWSLLLHDNQSYLGRCILVLRREPVHFLVDTFPEEHDELFVILGEWQEALTKLWQPDWWNYAQLGNSIPQLHFHLIPRYKEPREFERKKFVDERWGHNYSPTPKAEFRPEILQAVTKAIKDNLPG